MNKKKFFWSFFSIVLTCNIIAKEEPNRIYFHIDSIDRKIVIPILINDSITANLAFDSGAGIGAFDLDSTFCAKHSSVFFNHTPDTLVRSGSAWASKSFIATIHKFAPKANIGNTKLSFDYMRIYNWKQYNNNLKVDGLFNIPKNDSTHVWEINFANNYLEIHASDDFNMPNNCLVFPLLKNKTSSYPFNVALPLKITCNNSDTLNLNRLFMVDTGMPQDIALMQKADELTFFNKRKDAIWTVDMNDYKRYYIVNSTIRNENGEVNLDSLRIYTYTFTNSVWCDYLIGQNFLKRFNVFFDLKNKQIGLQPINNFSRIINPGHRRFHFSTLQTPKGQTIVKYIADYNENCYKTAGLKIGDQIIKINGKAYKEYSWKEKNDFYKYDQLTFEILRNGKLQKIIVKLDKNEKQGD